MIMSVPLFSLPRRLAGANQSPFDQMQSLNIVKIKAEKAKAIRKITGLFRVIEICVLLVLVSRFSVQLPVALKNSGVYFRDISTVLASPRFVFFVGNAILITLFAKSGHFSLNSSPKSLGTDFYDEFVEKSQKPQSNSNDPGLDVVYSEKQRKTEDGTIVNYRRSNSETIKTEKSPQRVLRRSETEKCKKIMCVDRGSSTVNPYPEDKMSNEEFRSKIEAFIARQQRFRREEAEYSVF